MYDARVLRVVFAEDNYLVREGTVALLTDAGDVDIVGTAASFDELLAAVEELAPDAVLTDIRMPPSGPTKASVPPSRSAPTTPTSAWSCSRSSPTRSTPTTC